MHPTNSQAIKWCRALGAAFVVAYVATGIVQADALRAAGVNGKAPSGAGAIQGFVSTITDNALWIIGTVAALAILMIGALFFFGHSRAQDYAARIAVGAVIVVAAPGIAS
jgi:hypothetical protein